MLSIVTRTALQCPFENILLLKQIQKYSLSKRLSCKTSKSEKGGEGDERQSFPASEGERGAGKRQTSYYEDDDDGDYEATLIGPLDIDGYLKASPKYAKQHQLPPSFTELSTWNAITALVWHKHEGLLSLWKGSFAMLYRNAAYPILQSSIRKWMETTLLSSHDDSLIPLSLSHSVMYRFTCLVASHSIVRIFLSPLELVQSRLMAQTCKKGLRKYKSTYHCLTTIVQEEFSPLNPTQTSTSTLLGIWLTPNLLIPSLFQHCLEPLFEHITPVLTDRLLHSRKASSLAVVLLDFGISALELLIMTPIETVRKRLQCQAMITTPILSGESRDFNTVVELSSSPLAYSSPLDCIWRIVMVEEGISGLYRGFKAKITFAFSVALLQFLSSINGLDNVTL